MEKVRENRGDKSLLPHIWVPRFSVSLYEEYSILYHRSFCWQYHTHTHFEHGLGMHQVHSLLILLSRQSPNRANPQNVAAEWISRRFWFGRRSVPIRTRAASVFEKWCVFSVCLVAAATTHYHPVKTSISINCRQTLQRLNRSLDKELELVYAIYKEKKKRIQEKKDSSKTCKER